ncbi:MAG: DUF6443 domain-containing protein, partial [Bacteroidota bacterium]
MILICGSLLLGQNAWGQCGGVVESPGMVSGPTSANAGSTETYISGLPGTGTLFADPVWSISGGVNGTDYTITGYDLNNTYAFIQWLKPGNYTIRANITRVNGSCYTDYYEDYDVTVTCPNPVPAIPSVIGAPFTTQIGCVVNLQVQSPQTGVTYHWYNSASGGSPFASGTSYNFSNSTAGSYSVYLEADDGCQVSARRQVNITVNGLVTPVISIDKTQIFLGQSVSLTVTNPQAGYDYYWYQQANGTSLGNGVSFTYTPGATGTFDYYAQVQVCDPVSSTTKELKVFALPQITSSVSPDAEDGKVYLCPGETTNLSLSGSYSGATYQWNLDGVAISGAQGNTLNNVSAPGNYTLTVTLSSGASGTSSYIRVVDNEYGDENYIITRSVLKEGVTNPAQVETLPSGDIIESVTYFDGLGRPIQQVGVELSPISQQDIVSPIVYDEFGRSPKSYL